MPLFQTNLDPKVAPDEAIVIVHRFTQMCQKWALEREIPKRTQRLAAAPTASDAAKLTAWIAYTEFLQHTLTELENGTLDHWFCEDITR